MPQTITVTGDNVSLDLILYRRDGRRGQELVAAALTLNPGLAALGPVIPVGTRVILPDPPATPRQALREPVSLFD